MRKKTIKCEVCDTLVQRQNMDLHITQHFRQEKHEDKKKSLDQSWLRCVSCGYQAGSFDELRDHISGGCSSLFT